MRRRMKYQPSRALTAGFFTGSRDCPKSHEPVALISTIWCAGGHSVCATHLPFLNLHRIRHTDAFKNMSSYKATVTWERGGARFTDNRYSRAHRWRFDGGAEVP